VRLQKPWPDGFTVNPNGKYGMRTHPITGRQTKHRGLDVAGTFPVTSAAPGYSYDPVADVFVAPEVPDEVV